MTHLPDAVAAVQMGLHVFPVEPGAKTPIRIYQDRTAEEAPWTIRWSEVATNDLNTVVEWWSYAPDANIGVACKPSGVFVVDCDQPKRDGLLAGSAWEYLHDVLGPRVDGETAFDQVVQRYGGVEGVAEAFDTFTVATGSGGKHFYYRWPDGVHSSQDSIIRGLLDVRGNGGERGGYVLGAGSVTDKGPYVAETFRQIRDAPPWLVELCRDKPRPVAPRSPLAQPRSVSFGGLVAAVRTAPDGNLNNALLWAARAMCADGGTEEQAVELLAPEYVAANGRGGQRQAEATIRSAYRLQNRKR
ncbi:bifunctional DNA primase/polymerase [Streptomyces sp. I8-5]|uniref:bifunctional DNA primase/polymerase n=1 Tax=Streptomyces sp. I8-5 TaxID=3104277 RepID=UPI00386E3A2A